MVEFLAGLGFSHQQVAATIKRFPHLLGYDTKGHLIPHCHYLKSLGLSDEDLRQLILLRPHVLVSTHSCETAAALQHRQIGIAPAAGGSQQ